MFRPVSSPAHPITARLALFFTLLLGALLIGTAQASIGDMEDAVTERYGSAKEERPCKVPGINLLRRYDFQDYSVWVGFRKVKKTGRGWALKSVYESFQHTSGRFIEDKEFPTLLKWHEQGNLWAAPREVILPSTRDFIRKNRRDTYGIYMMAWMRDDAKYLAVYKSLVAKPGTLEVDRDVFVVLDLDLYVEKAWQLDLFGPVIDYDRQDKGHLSNEDVYFEQPFDF